MRAPLSIGEVCQIIGGKPADLARLLGISDSAINQWEGVIPPKRAIQLEEKTEGKVTRYALRPDYFGAPPASAEQGRAA